MVWSCDSSRRKHHQSCDQFLLVIKGSVERKDQPSNTNLLDSEEGEKVWECSSGGRYNLFSVFTLIVRLIFFFQGKTFLPFLQTSHPCLKNRHFPWPRRWFWIKSPRIHRGKELWKSENTYYSRQLGICPNFEEERKNF